MLSHKDYNVVTQTYNVVTQILNVVILFQFYFITSNITILYIHVVQVSTDWW